MQPLVFEPLLKRIRWGGTRLGSLLGKPIGDHSDYAESWEIADHGDDQSLVQSGPLRGTSLSRLVKTHGVDLFGRHEGFQQFPLLIKYLDAHDWLSLQVHPDDEQAVTYDPREKGKTEAWVIIDAAADSQICAGLKQGVTRQQLEDALRRQAVEECLHMISAKPGDCLFIPAGTVHALGPGIVLAEIQQQSDLTFRLHDWGRPGTDGKPRPLHITESLDCTDFDRGPVDALVPVRLTDGDHWFEELVRCQYFVIRRHATEKMFRVATEEAFRVMMVLSGSATLLSDGVSLPLRAGSTVLVPASCPSVQVAPDGLVTMLDVFLP